MLGQRVQHAGGSRIGHESGDGMKKHDVAGSSQDEAKQWRAKNLLRPTGAEKRLWTSGPGSGTYSARNACATSTPTARRAGMLVSRPEAQSRRKWRARQRKSPDRARR